MTTLSADLQAALQGVCDSDYQDGNDRVGNWVWTWSCNPFGERELRKFSGCVTNLQRLGLVEVSHDPHNRDDDCLALTAAGFALCQRVPGRRYG